MDQLITLAAQSPLIHQDDTTMRIVDLRRPGSATAAALDPERKGTFTTNLLAYVDRHPVAMYFTGWQHAGENPVAVLQQRATEHAPPIQMCDALSRNLSAELESLLAHCLSHYPESTLIRSGLNTGRSLPAADGMRLRIRIA